MVGLSGYALTALGNGLLFMLLLTVRKPGTAKRLLMFGVLGSLLLATLQLGLALDKVSFHQVMLADGVKGLLWLLFICAVLGKNQQSFRALIRTPFTLLVLSPALLYIGLCLSGVAGAKWLYLLQTVLALQVMVLLETLYRQAGDDRWHYKPLVIYLGATSLFDFVMYADATMVNQLDPVFWAARGFVYALLLPALIIAVRRIKHWGIEIFISRDVVLHSSLLLVAGGYLFIMAMVGYAVRYIGGDWSGAVQVALAFLSLTLLVTLLLSNSFRTRVRVFITKHFFANQYDYREEWLKLSQALNASNKNLQQVYDDGLHSLMNAIDYSGGMLLKLQGKRFEQVSVVGSSSLNDVEKSVIEQLSEFMQNKRWLVDIEELRVKPFNYEGLKINHATLNQCHFQLVLPIYQDSHLWGLALLYADKEQRIRLDWELRDYLNAVIAQVANYLFHYEAAKELAENAQFAAFNRMSAFVLHDLKNVLAQIDLILCNAQQHKHNPEFIEDTFETLEHTKTRMERMLRQLTEKKEALPSSNRTLNLGKLVQKVVEERCQSLLPIPLVEVQDDIELSIDEEKFSNVLYHLISNAQQATDDAGEVQVKVSAADTEPGAFVEIIDNGCGMTEDFIATRLFKPFDTTKGNAGMGIGAYDAKNYIEKIGGRIAVASQVGQGSRFSLYLPETAAIEE
ncbi:XrtA/PEP-CTERM system histidine kinase PrsK [Bowmanella denitrificans]